MTHPGPPTPWQVALEAGSLGTALKGHLYLQPADLRARGLPGVAEQLSLPSEERLYFHAGDTILSMESSDEVEVSRGDIQEPILARQRTAGMFFKDSWPASRTVTASLVLQDGKLQLLRRIPWPERLDMSAAFARYTSIWDRNRWSALAQEEILLAVTGRDATLSQVCEVRQCEE